MESLPLVGPLFRINELTNMSSSNKSTGKVAVVTGVYHLRHGLTRILTYRVGSARGIGRAIALRLAEDGHHVAVNDIEALQSDGEALVKEIEKLGVKSKFYLCDV